MGSSNSPDSYARIVVEDVDFFTDEYDSYINNINANGGTNLGAGIELAYDVANFHYDENKAKRVVILTDAYANIGLTIPDLIVANTLKNNNEGIYFAGVGIGPNFEENFLNELTDLGKGTYRALITPQDATRIFVDGFMSFIDNAVDNVRFKIEYPGNLTHYVSAAEEVSQNPEEVQPIGFSYNSEQFFFEAFHSDTPLLANQEFTLEIEYDDELGQRTTESITLPLYDLLGRGEKKIKTAASIVTLANLVNGLMTCDQVFASGLYSQAVDEPLFISYKNSIDQLCSILSIDS